MRLLSDAGPLMGGKARNHLTRTSSATPPKARVCLTLNHHLRKGVWLPRSFTLSTLNFRSTMDSGVGYSAWLGLVISVRRGALS
jgi:hypothetical protein